MDLLPQGGRRGGKKAQNRYAAIKKAGIELAYKKLGETHQLNGRWVGFLDSKKKKDDLADSWIQCLSWLEPATPNTKKSTPAKKKTIEWRSVTSKKPLKKVEGIPSEWTEGNVKWWLLQTLPARYEIAPLKKKATTNNGLLNYYGTQTIPQEGVYGWIIEQGEMVTKPPTVNNLEELVIYYGLKKFHDKCWMTRVNS